MVKLLLSLVLLPTLALGQFSSPGIMQGVAAESGGGGFSWDFTETFEGSEVDSQTVSGYDNTGWTSSSASNDPNYATSPAPLSDSYSVWFGIGGRSITHTISPSGTTQGLCWQFNWGGTWGSFAESSGFRNGTTVLGIVDQRASGTLRIKHGTVTSADLTGWTTGTTYWVWLDYTPSTGAGDGMLRLYRATSSTKPASPSLEITTGDATGTPDNIKFYGVSNSGIYDNILYKDGVSGDGL